MFRSGIGYDVHRFNKGRKLILGGVEIPHAFGLEGHSDADVLSHAIADALLGAIGESDIGHHFPNTDESIRGISSLEILQRVGEILAEKNCRVVNVDATLIAEAPKIGPHLDGDADEDCGGAGPRGRAHRDQGDDQRRPGRARARRRNGRAGGRERGAGNETLPNESFVVLSEQRRRWTSQSTCRIVAGANRKLLVRSHSNLRQIGMTI